MKPLFPSVVSPDRISPELSLDLWRLRLSHMELKAGVVPEDDFRKFDETLRNGFKAVVFRCHRRVLQGFYAWRERTIGHGADAYVEVSFEYTYMNAAYRNHPLWALSGALQALPLFLRGKPVFFFGLTYPGSFISLHLMTAGLTTLRDGDLSPFQRAALQAFARDIGGAGFDDATGLVKVRLVAGERGAPRRANVRRLFERYEQLNPTWRQGHALPVMAELSLSAVAAAVSRAVGQAFASATSRLWSRPYGGGAMGAQVETPAPTMRNPMLVMYRGSMDPSDGR
jgi:hypothetical protein